MSGAKPKTTTVSSAATQAAHRAMIAARPCLKSCGAFGTFCDLPDRVLLHAGPPYAGPQTVPEPVINSAISAVLFEGWANDPDTARRMVLDASISLRPAQDFGLVTPLACVASSGTGVLQVVDAAGIAPDRFCPVNDGPGAAALRFGAPSNPARVARLVTMAHVATALNDVLSGGIDLLPLMAKGIAAGDDLHGNVAGMTAALTDRLMPGLENAAQNFVAASPQFGLNAIMGACAVLLAAGMDGVGGGAMVIAAGGNGVDFGWQQADAPGIWHTTPAMPPVGPLFTDVGLERIQPAIGDSAVIDACGFGAAILRHAPTLVEALAPFHADTAFDTTASAAFVGPHPLFSDDIRIGLSAANIGRHPGIILGMLDQTGRAGLIGRGLSPWRVI